jgi:hypothetical protein
MPPACITVSLLRHIAYPASLPAFISYSVTAMLPAFILLMLLFLPTLMLICELQIVPLPL